MDNTPVERQATIKLFVLHMYVRNWKTGYMPSSMTAFVQIIDRYLRKSNFDESYLNLVQVWFAQVDFTDYG